MDAASLRNRIVELQQAGALTRASAWLAGALLDRVSDQWTVMLTREQACEACGVTNWASARRSLNRLADAGLIGLHTNMRAYVYFLEPPQAEPARAETARERAETARAEPEDLTEPRQNCAPPRRNRADRAEIARQRAETARTPRKDQDQDQQQEGRIDPSYPAVDPSGGAGGTETAPEVRASAQKRRGTRPDDQPAAPAGPQHIPPAEQARSVRLLTDPEVGLYPKLAGDAAERYGFREIAAQVFRYLRDRAAGQVRSPGCIPQRLAKPEQFPAQLEADDLEHDLWLRHASEADLEWGRREAAESRRRMYIPDEYSDIILG
jgi:hypothetical protein